MFLTIQINDIVDVVKSAIILLFADDIKISYEIMNFNSQKFAIFTTERSRSIVKKIYTLNEYEIERKDEIRDHGIILDQRFSFASHIKRITVSARQMIGCIKRVSSVQCPIVNFQ